MGSTLRPASCHWSPCVGSLRNLDGERRQCEVRFMRIAIVTGLLLSGAVACGGDDDGSGDIDAPNIDAPPGDPDAAIDALAIDAPAAFTLTSTALTAGAVIPTMYSCNGTNVSPPLAWTGGPTSPGYAMVFTDITNTASPFVHSAIWDIPGSVMSLPENVEKVAEPTVPAGSKQPLAYDQTTRGYLGPCPGGTAPHTYEFAVYAVDEYPLTGVTLSSTRLQVRTAILAHDTAMATLTGTYTPP
jgi:Raf kinase inhibitor-like YbhB/YbcL family protein